MASVCGQRGPVVGDSEKCMAILIQFPLGQVKLSVNSEEVTVSRYILMWGCTINEHNLLG